MKSAILLVSALCCATACTAEISGQSSGTTNAPGTPGAAGGPAQGAGGATAGASSTGGAGTTIPGTIGAAAGASVPADPNAAGPMPLRRLTRVEYNNTVRDLLGDSSQPANDFPADLRGATPFPVAAVADLLIVSRLAEAAEALAKAADLTKLVPCQTADDACAGRFIDEFAGRAFRRPVLAAEKERLLALYKNARTSEGVDFNGGIRTLIEGILQSAPFLYHWELGPQPTQLEGQWVRLGPYEVASRLSYFLWGTMPDAELLQAAAANQLSTEAQVQAQALRMLESDRASSSIKTFFSQWLGLEEIRDRTKDAQLYPEFNDDLKGAMTAEMESLIDEVVLEGDGRFETLLTSSQATVSAPLAKLYGVTGSGANQQVRLDASQRGGLLTRAGFQALYGGPTGSNPVKRGVEIYRKVLCGVVPPPPGNVPPPKDASQGGTTRQRFDEHGQNACAKGCHALFDGLGFAFENYDGIGRYRTMDNGSPVDAAATTTLDGKQVAFQNGVELSRLLAESQQVKQCLTTQAASFGLGRAPTNEDAASVIAAVDAYVTGTKGFRDLLAKLAASRTFRYRAPAEGEVLQ